MELEINHLISNSLTSEKLKKQNFKYNQAAAWLVIVCFILGVILLILLIQFKDVLWTVFLVLGLILIVGSIFTSLLILKINSLKIKKELTQISKTQLEFWSLQSAAFFKIDLLLSSQNEQKDFIGKYNKQNFEILKNGSVYILKLKKEQFKMSNGFFNHRFVWNEKAVLAIKKNYLTCAIQYVSENISKNINEDFIELLEFLNKHGKQN